MTEAQILVVEDNPLVAQGMRAMLNNLGYSVPAVTGSGEEAVQLAGEMRPDLVLMDIKLEGDMDGVDAAEQLRARFDIPVVYVTGYADEATLERAKVTGPFGYILKPCEPRDLRRTIEMALYRHEMEEKLKETTRLNQILLDSFPCVALLLRPHTREVVASNEAAVKAGAVPGTHCYSTWAQRDEPCPWCLGPELWATGEAQHLEIEALGIVWDAHWIPVAPDLYMHYAFDITEQRRMEAELHRAQKLESIGILAGGIAHDFNNLLTSILGNISLAQMDAQTAGQEDMVDTLAHAERASLRATDLTKQLLTFSTGGAPVKVTLSISNLLRDSANFALRGSKVQCRFAIAEDLWPVDVDEGQMGQAINNLVINAQQAMPQGGTITVRAENRVVPASRQDADSTKMPGLTAGEYVAISVEDKGTGIPAERLSQIFDPYFTTKQKGSGLGLATAHSIIKRHGGHIRVESTVGEGTTFHIYLPASSGEIAAERVERMDIIQGQGKVLVMDDEEAVRALAVRLLKRAGYEVEQAPHGAKAIELCRQAHASGSPFELVVLDLTVRGGMGGVEAIRHLRKFHPQVKAIVSSGYSMDAVMSDFEGYGFNGVLPKPYEPAQLSQVVDKVMRQKRDGTSA